MDEQLATEENSLLTDDDRSARDERDIARVIDADRSAKDERDIVRVIDADRSARDGRDIVRVADGACSGGSGSPSGAAAAVLRLSTPAAARSIISQCKR